MLIPESEKESREVLNWATEGEGHVFKLVATGGKGVQLKDIGPVTEACRVPILVVSDSKEPSVQLISNFAHTPFELHGKCYESVEGFWQGLKYANDAERERIAKLHGTEAKRSGNNAVYSEVLTYKGEKIRVGTYDHWVLMAQACQAKFEQNSDARDALLSTGQRPLVHKVRRDSRTIPGVIMAEIWMTIREQLSRKKGNQKS